MKWVLIIVEMFFANNVKVQRFLSGDPLKIQNCLNLCEKCEYVLHFNLSFLFFFLGHGPYSHMFDCKFLPKVGKTMKVSILFFFIEYELANDFVKIGKMKIFLPDKSENV